MTSNEKSVENVIILPQEEGANAIKKKAYYQNEELVNIVIREGVTKIGEDAFFRCPNLVSVKLPSTLKKIEERAFCDCSKLKEITLPDSLTQLDSSAFCGCQQLKEMKIPNKVKTIESGLFADCCNLEKVTLPNGITELPYGIFEDATSLKEVELPKSLEKIDACAFEGCTSLTSIELPDNVKEIAFFAFKDCTSLSKIKFSEKLETIHNEAFLNCTSLKKVEIPASVSTIEGNAFPKETEIIISPDNKNLLIKDQLILSADGTKLHSCLSNAETIKIPSTVTTIGWGAFSKNPYIKNIVLPKSVEILDKHAFEGCTSLRSVVMEEGVKIIDEYAFMGCPQLEEITFPESLCKIGSSAFHDCVSLKKLHIPSKVETIGSEAFRGCSGLTELTIASSGKIEWAAFKDCEHLISIDVASSSIDNGAFYNCPELTTVTFRETASYITIHAFSSGKLTTVHLMGLNKTIDGQSFVEHVDLESIYVDRLSPWMEVTRDDFSKVEALAKKGDVEALKKLGDYYYNGEGVRKSPEEAAKCYLLAAKKGDVEAQWRMAWDYTHGIGVECDYKIAYKWAKEAAEQGDCRAQSLLGSFYLEGNGVEQNYETAAEWYRKAIKNGDKYAKDTLDKLIKKGLVLPEDASKLEDPTFGTISHNGKKRWISKTTTTFSGKEYPFEIELEGSEKEGISETQRTAYANYLQKKEEYFEAVQKRAKELYKGANKKKNNELRPLALYIDRSGNYGWKCHKEWGGEPMAAILSENDIQLALDSDTLYKYASIKENRTNTVWHIGDRIFMNLFGVLTELDILASGYGENGNEGDEISDRNKELLSWLINELDTEALKKEVIKHCNNYYKMWCSKKITAKDLLDEVRIYSIYLNGEQEEDDNQPEIFLTGGCECDDEHGIGIGFKDKEIVDISEESIAF
ncbi:MAG: leucine-rich repeat protein [Paludibacteraceae bacterium]|nr:leucine-rich repeat protein [Paludibacteraceae bacterium]